MQLLHALHGWSAIVVLCSLIFVEEAGVPLPMAPGDLLLVGAGVLISTGVIDPAIFLPLAFLASLGGALVGYTWARAIGAKALTALAGRLRAGDHLERASARLRSAGPVAILVARLIPGMRINTTLVSGSLQVRRRIFLAGLLPSIAVWEAVFIGIGAALGAPIEHYLGRLEHLMVRGVVFVAIGLAGYLAVRQPIPASACELAPPQRRFHTLRMVLAVIVDLAAIGLIVGGVDNIVDALAGREESATILVGLQLAISVALYVGLSRAFSRNTLGEAIFRVTYRARRGRRDPVPAG